MIYYKKVGVPRSALQFCQCQFHSTVRTPIYNSIITRSKGVLNSQVYIYIYYYIDRVGNPPF